MANVTIYSTPTCQFCKMAKVFLEQNNVQYTDYDVSTDQNRAQEMVSKSGQMGVPVIDIDGDIIVGFDQSSISKKLGI